MKWLRSLITFNLITWLGIVSLGSIVAFLFQSRFRIERILLYGLEPFPECNCTLVSLWSSSTWVNIVVMSLMILGMALLIWSFISFIRVTFATIRFTLWVNRLRQSALYDGRFIDLLATNEPLIFCYGLFNPHIAVSRSIIQETPDEELAVIIQHEVHHQQEMDPLRLFVIQWLQQTFFFIPGFRDVIQLFKLSIEIEADASISEPAVIRQALLRWMNVFSRNANKRSSLAPVAYFSVTEARLGILVGRAPSIPGWKIVTGLLIPVLMTTVFIFFSQSSGVFAQEFRNTQYIAQQSKVLECKQSTLQSPILQSTLLK